MISITVDDSGTPRVIDDEAPLLTEQADILERLARIYADFEHRPANALDAEEPVIVMLHNRYYQLDDWIDDLRALGQRRANIDAGRKLLQDRGGARS